ncbi:hypothetical protein IKN40_00645 [bacterium]|nr:hypothetical protein [bacterium]
MKYSNWNDFMDEFVGHDIIFLSDSDESLPLLVNKKQNGEVDGENRIENKIFYLSKIPSVVKVLEDFDIAQFPN